MQLCLLPLRSGVRGAAKPETAVGQKRPSESVCFRGVVYCFQRADLTPGELCRLWHRVAPRDPPKVLRFRLEQRERLRIELPCEAHQDERSGRLTVDPLS
jgi:hypothetical protein